MKISDMLSGLAIGALIGGIAGIPLRQRLIKKHGRKLPKKLKKTYGQYECNESNYL